MNKSRRLAVLAASFIGCSTMTFGIFGMQPAWASSTNAFAGGNGTSSAPFQIATPAQFEYFDNLLNNNSGYQNDFFELTANINMNGYTAWVPIENFAGTFNGNGNTISNLDITQFVPYEQGYVTGIFGATSQATIENVTLNNVNVDVAPNSSETESPLGAGILSGVSTFGELSDIHVEGGIVSSPVALFQESGVGGVAGVIMGTQLTNDFSNASVMAPDGSASAGGLVGWALGGNIHSSAAVGRVVGGAENGVAGGLVGTLISAIPEISSPRRIEITPMTRTLSSARHSTAQYVNLIDEYPASTPIINAYATGSVSGYTAGGLVGINGQDSDIANTYATGTVLGAIAGSIAGANDGSIISSFTDNPSIPTVGSKGPNSNLQIQILTPQLMGTEAPFKNAGWNFSDVWEMPGGGNPPVLSALSSVSVWMPPVLEPETVSVGGITSEVIANQGYNPLLAILNGTYMGYVEERAAIEAGATFSGEGVDSSYLSAILSGAGVGLQQHVSAIQQGQFAALYQKLGIIPTWVNNTVTMSSAIQTLIKAKASTLAIENYMVQMDGLSWTVAEAEAAQDFGVGE